jgi:dTDP-4-dehydrorhamnose 3,5-epimerase
MKITRTSLPDILVLTPDIYRDSRGAFWETWNQFRMVEAGLPETWTQDNFSLSKKNVVRGIHYQITQPQGKLVRVSHGAALDVAVDLRRSSPTFGKHVAVELTAENAQILWIPEGFGYKVTDSYSPTGERTILWNDTDLAIPWPIAPECAVLSDKDLHGASFREAEVFA